MRFLIACLGAPVITFLLLLFMAGLINQQAKQHRQKQENPYFDLLVNVKDESYESRKRNKPKPPELKPEPMTAQTELIQNQVSNPKMDVDFEIPNLAISNKVSAMPLSLPGIKSLATPSKSIKGNTMAMPLYRVQPRYPRKALRLGKQGYVVLSFDINEAGRVVNIKVLKAKPLRLFEKEAVRALKHWKYKPMLINGEAVSQIGQSIRLDFQIEK